MVLKIGILSREIPPVYQDREGAAGAKSFIPTDYCNFIKDAGAEAYGVIIDHTEGVPVDYEYLSKCFDSLDGVLMMGGHCHFAEGKFFEVCHFFWEESQKIAEEGGYFPIISICMGIQWMIDWIMVREYAKQNEIELNIENWPKWREIYDLVGVCKTVEGNKNTLAKFDMIDESSLIFSDMDKGILKKLQKGKKFAYYGNEESVLIELLEKRMTELKISPDFLSISGTSLVGGKKDGKEFATIAEVKKYGWISTQFHPEKVGNDFKRLNFRRLFNMEDKLPKKFSMHLARAFLKECEKGLHSKSTGKVPDDSMPLIDESLKAIDIKAWDYSSVYFFY